MNIDPNTRDEFGDRMKSYEAHECDRHFLPQIPVYARLDGRSFHTFCRRMNKPFDENFNLVMVDTMKYLVDHTHAVVGYTQSDEISLAWLAPTHKSEIFFNRRIFKMTSVLAGMASAFFNQHAMELWPDLTKRLVPCFDSRVYMLPSPNELANCFVWRNLDATKNAISMAASCYYSPAQLHKKSGAQKQEMLFARGINFNDYPESFKRGVFARRERFEVELAEETRLKIPEASRPPAGHKVVRSEVRLFSLPPLTKVANKVGALFGGEAPIPVDGTPA